MQRGLLPNSSDVYRQDPVVHLTSPSASLSPSDAGRPADVPDPKGKEHSHTPSESSLRRLSTASSSVDPKSLRTAAGDPEAPGAAGMALLQGPPPTVLSVVRHQVGRAVLGWVV